MAGPSPEVTPSDPGPTAEVGPSRGEPRSSSGRRVVAIVLAAGRAERFGSTKQLAELEGRPLVAHAVTSAAAAVERVVVVVGHDAEAVTRAVREVADVEVVVNPAYASGQASSLLAGIRAAETAAADVAVVVLADEPRVSPAAIVAVTAAVDADVAAARARYDDGPGHPVAFARRVFGRLHELTGDRGAKQLLEQLGAVEVAVAGPRPRDVDTPADLRSG